MAWTRKPGLESLMVGAGTSLSLRVREGIVVRGLTAVGHLPKPGLNWGKNPMMPASVVPTLAHRTRKNGAPPVEWCKRKPGFLRVLIVLFCGAILSPEMVFPQSTSAA